MPPAHRNVADPLPPSRIRPQHQNLLLRPIRPLDRLHDVDRTAPVRAGALDPVRVRVRLLAWGLYLTRRELDRLYGFLRSTNPDPGSLHRHYPGGSATGGKTQSPLPAASRFYSKPR